MSGAMGMKSRPFCGSQNRTGQPCLPAVRVAHFHCTECTQPDGHRPTHQTHILESTGASGPGGRPGQISVIWGTEGREFKSRQPDKQCAGQAVFLESTLWPVIASAGPFRTWRCRGAGRGEAARRHKTTRTVDPQQRQGVTRSLDLGVRRTT